MKAQARWLLSSILASVVLAGGAQSAFAEPAGNGDGNTVHVGGGSNGTVASGSAAYGDRGTQAGAGSAAQKDGRRKATKDLLQDRLARLKGAQPQPAIRPPRTLCVLSVKPFNRSPTWASMAAWATPAFPLMSLHLHRGLQSHQFN
jgi:hypothetical protein